MERVADDRAEVHARVLVVAGRTATAPSVADAVARRAARGPALFHLLIPSIEEPTISARQPLIESDRMLARALLSTVHHELSSRLHLDLPRRVAHVGLPVTTVLAAAVASTERG